MPGMIPAGFTLSDAVSRRTGLPPWQARRFCPRHWRRAHAPDITLRFSHVVAEETPKGLAANRFKVLVEQRSGGRIGVQVFPNAQLYGDHDEMQALQLGAVDLRGALAVQVWPHRPAGIRAV